MKNRLIMAAMALSLFAGVIRAQGDDKAVELEIRRLHEEQRQAFLSRDVAALERIFSPDFVVTNPAGDFLTAQQTIDRVKNGEIDFARFERHIDYVKVYGDTVVAAGRETMVPRGKMKGAGTVINLRMTTVWIRRGGAWREVARHTSVLSQTEGRK